MLGNEAGDDEKAERISYIAQINNHPIKDKRNSPYDLQKSLPRPFIVLLDIIPIAYSSQLCSNVGKGRG